MSTRHVLLFAAALAACAPAARGPAAPAAQPVPGARLPRGVDVSAMDRSVRPGADFYAFANGAWQRRTEIPPDRPYVGSFLAVAELVEGRLRAIAEEATRSDAPAGSELRKIGDCYASFLDEDGIEAKGLAPLRPELARIAAVGDARALAAHLGATVRADVDALNNTMFYTPNVLGLWVEQDLNDPSRNAPYLLQGGLGMPDRAYYLEPGFAAVRAAYERHLAAMLSLAGVPDAPAVAARVAAFETRLARAHATREESMDVARANNPWTATELAARAPGLDWAAFLGAAGLAGQPRFIVWHPTAVTGLAALAASEPLSLWREYLTVRALERAAPFLPRAFAAESFAFHGTTLSGTPRQRDRWKRALGVLDDTLGEAVGRRYVARHFPPEARAEVQVMVRNIVAAFGRRIDALDWMSPATRARAKEKLASLRVGIAYPDRWRDYAGLEIVRGDALGNALRSAHFEYRHVLSKLSRPPDHDEWAMLPQTVNALNLPVRNALNFPAAFMEPPLFDRAATPAVKYASLGAVIGHEISHAFDDQGALFDARGKLESWWTPEDLRRFQAAGERLAEQYGRYRPFPDLAVNGRLTLSENIADLAGLAASYDAWRAAGPAAAAAGDDGLTADQAFFVAYAQAWQDKAREAALRLQITTDGHAPGPYRALTVRNLDPWYAAFGVGEGEPLFLGPAERVRVW